MSFGGYEIKVAVDGLPQQVATAFPNILDNLFGAQYQPVAYLGSQVVNGINHAILAEQTVITGRDTVNAVLVILNEKPGSIGGKDFALVNIVPILESGGPMGGIHVDIKTEIPAEAKEVFDAAKQGFVGSNIEAFAYLGSQAVKGINYFFAAQVTPVAANPKNSIKMITVNSFEKKLQFSDII